MASTSRQAELWLFADGRLAVGLTRLGCHILAATRLGGRVRFGGRLTRSGAAPGTRLPRSTLASLAVGTATARAGTAGARPVIASSPAARRGARTRLTRLADVFQRFGLKPGPAALISRQHALRASRDVQGRVQVLRGRVRLQRISEVQMQNLIDDLPPLRSAQSTNVTATPSRPARPVRPIRCR